MPDSFEVEAIIPAEPQRVYAVWLDAREHAAFTGGGEAVVEAWPGGRFTSWEGYIHGILLGLDAGRRIVQTWRTADFPAQARDSRVVVEFEPHKQGTRVRVKHSDLPVEHVQRTEKGWLEHYLKPLARYLTKGGKAAAKPLPIRERDAAWGQKEAKPAGRGAKKTAATPAKKTAPAARKGGTRPATKPKAAAKPAGKPAARAKRAPAKKARNSR